MMKSNDKVTINELEQRYIAAQAVMFDNTQPYWVRLDAERLSKEWHIALAALEVFKTGR